MANTVGRQSLLDDCELGCDQYDLRACLDLENTGKINCVCAPPFVENTEGSCVCPPGYGVRVDSALDYSGVHDKRDPLKKPVINRVLNYFFISFFKHLEVVIKIQLFHQKLFNYSYRKCAIRCFFISRPTVFRYEKSKRK